MSSRAKCAEAHESRDHASKCANTSITFTFWPALRACSTPVLPVTCTSVRGSIKKKSSKGSPTSFALPVGLLGELRRCAQSDRSREADQAVAAGEEDRFD